MAERAAPRKLCVSRRESVELAVDEGAASAPTTAPAKAAHLHCLLAGGIAGVVSRTSVAPLERVKILFQVQGLSSQGAPPRHTSVARSITSIARAEGVGGLWRGNGANCVRVFPSSACQFWAYAELKRRMFGGREPGPHERLVAGGLAGATAQTITYPLDFIRARLSTDLAGRYSSGMWAALATIIRTEGVGALYRGLTPSLLGAIPYVGIDFAVYDTLRAYVPRQTGTDDPSVLGKLAAGAFAGACGQTAAYPLDTVRRILQVQDVKVKHGGVRYAGMVDALGGVVRRDGVRALYAGLGVNILKVVPSVSISFVVFEAARDRLAATL